MSYFFFIIKGIRISMCITNRYLFIFIRVDKEGITGPDEKDSSIIFLVSFFWPPVILILPWTTTPFWTFKIGVETSPSIRPVSSNKTSSLALMFTITVPPTTTFLATILVFTFPVLPIIIWPSVLISPSNYPFISSAPWI